MKAVKQNPLEPVLFEVAEVGLHYVRQCPLKRPRIEASSDAGDLLRPFFATCQDHHEEFYVLCLNQRNDVLAAYRAGAGGITGTVVDVRLIFQTALLCNATGLVLAHNHPSGNPQASHADIKLTQKVKGCAEFMDMRLIDHVIITASGYTSFADEGLL